MASLGIEQGRETEDTRTGSLLLFLFLLFFRWFGFLFSTEMKKKKITNSSCIYNLFFRFA